ncbi:MAG: selenium-dependent molybdenum cofactor biosynthesis protein YqeB [Bacillota bacterium]|nr:selenium-dependent molybdenum cofactor biosynthesis protein YqeB [Bacillota bacterium]
MKYRDLIVVRGGGDIASGTIYRLYKSGYKVVVLEIEKPTSIRRIVSFSQCVYDKEIEIEGVKAVLCSDIKDIELAHKDYKIPVVVDPEGNMIKKLKPRIVVDSILAKKNMGTKKDMADLVIGLGPGFTAKEDVDIVIETNRGHYLGSVIYKGKAERNTGKPGSTMGFTTERVIYSPANGKIQVIKDITSIVQKGDILAKVDGHNVEAKISGVVRGMIQPDSKVHKDMKIGDIDPRKNIRNCITISDKAKSIGGGVLEAVLHYEIDRE